MIPHSKPCLSEKDVTAVTACINRGYIGTGGPKTNELHQSLLDWLGLDTGFLVGSGTIATTAALAGIGVRTGDEVILSNYLCPSVADAISSIGAKPVPVDVAEDALFPDALEVQRLITNKTTAIIIPYMYGVETDTSAFSEMSLKVVEDCCQTFYFRHQFQLQGDAAVFSFHPTKLFACTGGGFVGFSDSGSATNAERFIKQRCYSEFGDLESSLLLSQLEQIEKFLNRRKEIAERYHQEISGFDKSLMEKYWDHSKFYRYVLRSTGDFNSLREAAEEKGVMIRKGVDSLIHQHLDMEDSEFHNSLELLKTTISIPIYPDLTDENVNQVITVMNSLAT